MKTTLILVIISCLCILGLLYRSCEQDIKRHDCFLDYHKISKLCDDIECEKAAQQERKECIAGPVVLIRPVNAREDS